MRGRVWRVGARHGAAFLFAVLALSATRPASAQYPSDRYSAIVVEAANGGVLYAASSDQLRFPASLTKLMTLYMLFEALRDRRAALDELVPVSWHAASAEPSKLGLVPGTRITVEEALLGLVTKSANDAASALGEMMAGGSEERFGQMMTLRARALGMTHTTFRNASGLPDPYQVTTAEDMALLARHLVQDFPEQYRYFSVPGYLFQGRMIPNHDHMLQTFPGADGLKTGYTVASGFNLVTSAMRGGVRLVGVILGANSTYEREQNMTAMLNAGFQRMGVAPVFADPPAPQRLAGFFGVAHASVMRPRLHARRAIMLEGPITWGRGAVRVQQVALLPQRGRGGRHAGPRTVPRTIMQAAFATVSARVSHAVAPHYASHSGRRRWHE